jgi:hypothetical protein
MVVDLSFDADLGARGEGDVEINPWNAHAESGL